MDSKQRIIDQVTTLAVLKPLTSEAKEAIPRGQLEGEFVCIKKLPFKIGRESRVKRVKGKLERLERPKMGGKEPNNNLYLVDQGRFLNISREHLQIERDENDFVL
ncbi:MAG: hypothetical protein GY702_05325, partial [Desulfobulbaceae bacterium]|nr:hypothetical protein [Desulfobulbaceae bacterium]